MQACNTYEQKLFEVLRNVKEYKWLLKPKCLRAITLRIFMENVKKI